MNNKNCPACGGTLRAADEWLSYCGNCGLYRSTLQAGPGKAFEGLEHIRRKNFETILNRIAEIRPLAGLRVLEIGCSRGWFLEAARARGTIVFGVEPVHEDAEVARAAGFLVEEGLFPDRPLDPGPYDIIVFNDVFEHLPEPAAASRAVAERLAPGGLAVVNLPSSRGAIYNVARLLRAAGLRGPFERMWQKGLPSPHLTYFSPVNLRLLFERNSTLREVMTFTLPSISRSGLSDRVSSRNVGIPSWLLTPALWAMSFVLPLLPADIHVGVFTKEVKNNVGLAP